jgi:predicted transcriptional regulator
MIISIYLKSKELQNDLRSCAKKENRSISYIVTQAIDQYVNSERHIKAHIKLQETMKNIKC